MKLLTAILVSAEASPRRELLHWRRENEGRMERTRDRRMERNKRSWFRQGMRDIARHWHHITLQGTPSLQGGVYSGVSRHMRH